jgi:hypothetical protein
MNKEKESGLMIKADLDVTVEERIIRVIAFREELVDWDSGAAEIVMKQEIMLEALEKSARHQNLNELESEISKTRIVIARWFGQHLMSNELRPSDINMNKDLSHRYQKIARMPDHIFEFALEATRKPTVNSVLSEHKRYSGIVAAVTAANWDEAKAHVMFREGYSVLQAEREVSGGGDEEDSLSLSDFEDDDDTDIDWDTTFDLESFGNAEEAVTQISDEINGLFISGDLKLDDLQYQTAISILKRLRSSTRQISEVFKEIRDEKQGELEAS